MPAPKRINADGVDLVPHAFRVARTFPRFRFDVTRCCGEFRSSGRARRRCRSGGVRYAVLAATLAASASSLLAETRPINVNDSTLTVFVYKSGLFSAFADDHTVKAPIASGSISDGAPLSVELTVHSADLRVLDPNLSADKRADVQARMISADVLDVTKYPEIVFASTAIEPGGADRWNVTGRLTVHGQTRSLTFPVVRVNGRYRGEVAIKQRDFGIEPIRIAGGAVKVKDELRIQFDIAR
jgi:polyisoprenoid-binding protein YceI